MQQTVLSLPLRGLWLLILSTMVLPFSASAGICEDKLTGGTIAQLLRESGNETLVHRTKIARVAAILKEGALSPSVRRLGGQEGAGETARTDAVFFDLEAAQKDSIENASEAKRYSSGGATSIRNMRDDFWVKQKYGSGMMFWKGLNQVTLEFSLDALDGEAEYHISSNGWNYGDRLPRDFVYTPGSMDNVARLRKFLSEISVGELVYNDEMSLKFLKAIYVVEIYYKDLLTQLRNEGVTSINGKPLEDVIRPVKIQKSYHVTDEGVVLTD